MRCFGGEVVRQTTGTIEKVKKFWESNPVVASGIHFPLGRIEYIQITTNCGRRMKV